MNLAGVPEIQTQKTASGRKLWTAKQQKAKRTLAPHCLNFPLLPAPPVNCKQPPQKELIQDLDKHHPKNMAKA